MDRLKLWAAGQILLVAVLVALSPADVRGQALARVPDCPSTPYGTGVFRRALRLELALSGFSPVDVVGADEPLPPDLERYVLVVTIFSRRCDGAVRLSVRGARAAISDELRLDDVPPIARARALAVAIAERARLAVLQEADEPPEEGPVEPEQPLDPPLRAASLARTLSDPLVARRSRARPALRPDVEPPERPPPVRLDEAPSERGPPASASERGPPASIAPWAAAEVRGHPSTGSWWPAVRVGVTFSPLPDSVLVVGVDLGGGAVESQPPFGPLLLAAVGFGAVAGARLPVGSSVAFSIMARGELAYVYLGGRDNEANAATLWLAGLLRAEVGADSDVGGVLDVEVGGAALGAAAMAGPTRLGGVSELGIGARLGLAIH